MVFLRVRRLGRRNLGRAAAREPPAGGARIGGRRPRRLPGLADSRTRHRTASDSVRTGGVVAAGPGVRGPGGGRRAVRGGDGGPLGAGPDHDQCLRSDGNHVVRDGQRAAGARRRSGTDRRAGPGCGVVRARRVAAPGARRRGRRVVCGRPWRRGGVCAPGGADGVAVRGMPVRTARTADVSHRGPGVLGRRRPAALPGPRR